MWRKRKRDDGHLVEVMREKWRISFCVFFDLIFSLPLIFRQNFSWLSDGFHLSLVG